MLHLSQDHDADEFLTGNWLALLIGMVLDQQVTIEKAFSSPPSCPAAWAHRSMPRPSPPCPSTT